jgi:uncharacterized membrane protein
VKTPNAPGDQTPHDAGNGGFDLFEAWKEHEKVAMHFNDLLIRLRAQSLGAVAAIAAVAGVVLKGEGVTADLRWGTLAAVFAVLAMLWVALWVLDFAYYNRLLLGAVDALLKVEEASKSGSRLNALTLSRDIEQAVRNSRLGSPLDHWARTKGLWAFYLIVLAVLVAGFGGSLWAVSTGGLQASLAAPQRATAGMDRAFAWFASSGPADWVLAIIGFVTAIVAIRTLRAIEHQVAANVSAADAAKDNATAAKQTAEIAGTQLRLAFRPYFDLKDVFAEVAEGNDRSTSLAVGYKVYNASQTPAPVFRLDTGYVVTPGGEDMSIAVTGRQYETTLAPGRGYDVPIDVGPLSEQAKQAYLQRRLLITVTYRIWFKDPFGAEFDQTMERAVQCGPDFVQSYRGSFTGLKDE